jgi:hypothetical protein
MSTAARKARKRAGIPFAKPVKRPAGQRARHGLGLVTGAEILASLVVHGRL